ESLNALFQHVETQWRRNQNAVRIAGALIRSEFVCAVGSTDSDRKRITACPAYELLYFFRTGVALMSGFHNDFVLDTSQSTQLSLNNYAMSMRVLNDFLGDLDVLLERLGGSVNHNGGKSAVDTGFAGLKAIAMIQMQRDRNIRILNHCR